MDEFLAKQRQPPPAPQKQPYAPPPKWVFEELRSIKIKEAMARRPKAAGSKFLFSSDGGPDTRADPYPDNQDLVEDVADGPVDPLTLDFELEKMRKRNVKLFEKLCVAEEMHGYLDEFLQFRAENPDMFLDDDSDGGAPLEDTMEVMDRWRNEYREEASFAASEEMEFRLKQHEEEVKLATFKGAAEKEELERLKMEQFVVLERKGSAVRAGDIF